MINWTSGQVDKYQHLEVYFYTQSNSKVFNKPAFPAIDRPTNYNLQTLRVTTNLGISYCNKRLIQTGWWNHKFDKLTSNFQQEYYDYMSVTIIHLELSEDTAVLHWSLNQQVCPCRLICNRKLTFHRHRRFTKRICSMLALWFGPINEGPQKGTTHLSRPAAWYFEDWSTWQHTAISPGSDEKWCARTDSFWASNFNPRGGACRIEKSSYRQPLCWEQRIYCTRRRVCCQGAGQNESVHYGGESSGRNSAYIVR